jgi:hypothetical protein
MKNEIDATDSSMSQSQSKSSSAYLWLSLGLGAILRLATLGRQSLWLDEGFSYWMANRP